MGDPSPDRNSAQQDGGVIHLFISSDEVRLTFCEPYERNLVCTQTSRRRSDGTVWSFRKTSNARNGLRRQSRSDRARSFPVNATP